MAERRPNSDGPIPHAPDFCSTSALLTRIRLGDPGAREELFTRCLGPLRRWAHGRLPGYARSLVETDDLVQNTLIRALNQTQHFEPRWEGAFLAYLRRILLNQIRDEIRRARRSPGHGDLPVEIPDDGPSPVEQVLGKETLDRYETALGGLPPRQQEAVVMSLEMGFSHREIGEALGSPSPAAARMMVARAVVRLAEAIRSLK